MGGTATSEQSKGSASSSSSFSTFSRRLSSPPLPVLCLLVLGRRWRILGMERRDSHRRSDSEGVVRSMFVPALIDTSTAWSLVPARPLGNVCCPLGLLVCLCSSRSKQQHNSYRRVIMKLKTPHLSPPKRRDFAPRDHVAFTSSHAPIRPSTIVVHSSTTLHYGSQ